MTSHSAYSQNSVLSLEGKTARKEEPGKHHDVIRWMSNGAVWLSFVLGWQCQDIKPAWWASLNWDRETGPGLPELPPWNNVTWGVGSAHCSQCSNLSMCFHLTRKYTHTEVKMEMQQSWWETVYPGSLLTAVSPLWKNAGIHAWCFKKLV